jgi:hypothetical protein
MDECPLLSGFRPEYVFLEKMLECVIVRTSESRAPVISWESDTPDTQLTTVTEIHTGSAKELLEHNCSPLREVLHLDT